LRFSRSTLTLLALTLAVQLVLAALPLPALAGELDLARYWERYESWLKKNGMYIESTPSEPAQESPSEVVEPPPAEEPPSEVEEPSPVEPPSPVEVPSEPEPEPETEPGADYYWRIWLEAHGYATSQPAPEEDTRPEPAPVEEPADEDTEQPIPPSGLSSEEQQVFNWLNADRQAEGVNALSYHPELTQLARLRAAAIAELGHLDHTPPEYGAPNMHVREAGISFESGGENQAKAASLYVAYAALKASNAHRKNMFNPAYTDVGIGVAQDEKGYVYIVQLFIER